MSYTPVELRHVRVGRSLFGYNRAMVEQVIEEVAESFEATWRERGELADRVEFLEKEIAELRRREELLTHTLVAAEQAASDVRDRARREAETIIAEAHNEARSIGRSAQADRERLITESRRIEGMLRAALALIEERAVAVTVVPSEPRIAPAAVESQAPAAAERPAEPSPAGSTWAREDTREFEPIVPVHEPPAVVLPPVLEEPPVEAALPSFDEDDAEADEPDEPDVRRPLEAVLHRLPGAESRDFDWGE